MKWNIIYSVIAYMFLGVYAYYIFAKDTIHYEYLLVAFNIFIMADLWKIRKKLKI